MMSLTGLTITKYFLQTSQRPSALKNIILRLYTRLVRSYFLSFQTKINKIVNRILSKAIERHRQ